MQRIEAGRWVERSVRVRVFAESTGGGEPARTGGYMIYRMVYIIFFTVVLLYTGTNCTCIILLYVIQYSI